MAGLTIDMTAALASARALGSEGWPAIEMLLAIRVGMAAGIAANRPVGRTSPHG